MMLEHYIPKIIETLRDAGIDNPQLDARLLAAHGLGLDRAALLSQSRRILTNDEMTAIDGLIARRAAHESVARIKGVREFWGLEFGLNEATLEPRPDSECVIEAVIKEWQTKNDEREENIRILDLGTGTGCLLLALLHEFPAATGIGIDIAPRAVEQATRNAAALGLSDRAHFVASNWFDGI